MAHRPLGHAEGPITKARELLTSPGSQSTISVLVSSLICACTLQTHFLKFSKQSFEKIPRSVYLRTYYRVINVIEKSCNKRLGLSKEKKNYLSSIEAGVQTIIVTRAK